jgi:hypothetical protein
MAKTATANKLTTVKGGAVSKNVMDAAAKYAGKGISDRQEDNIVPLVYLLQSNSPQTQKGNEKFVKGATGGAIWLRNAPEGANVFDGEDGIEFQPCHFSVCWIEWQPNRGGFVARHPSRPEAAVLVDVERDDGTIGKRWQMPNGNTVAESREYAGFVYSRDGERADDMAYTIPFGGTNLTVAKQWMSSMRSEKLPSGERAPLFANKFLLKTKLRQRGKFSWFVYEIDKIGPVETVEEIERGNALADAFSTGAKQSAAQEDAVHGAGDDVDD